MVLEGISIEHIRLAELPDLAARLVSNAAPGAFIPITIHRAQAHSQNPHAQPDDVVLLLAKAGDAPVGYFGLMAVMLQVGGRLARVHWLTTWGVAPGYLGRGLGSALMQAALDLDVDLAIVGSAPARRVSAKFGFVEAQPLEYVQLDLGGWAAYNPVTLALRLLRKLLSFLDVRWSVEKTEPRINRFFERLLKPFLRPWLNRRLGRRLSPAAGALRMQPIQTVPGFALPAEHTGFVRSQAVVNWMLAHPWVAPAGQSASEDLNYGFTDSRAEFVQSAWALSGPGGEEWGFACFQSSRLRGRKILKVLDHHLAPGAPADLLAAAAVQLAARQQTDLIEGPAGLAKPFVSGRLPWLLQRKQRTLQLHPHKPGSPLDQALPKLTQTFCDGDMAFT
ncbi:MAG: GNAT family N-acetyltransferase [Anaerolineales bacterium]|nr:GNAT family N-acetyltransferase [Anaerolineales bacterium]MCW5856394.1 GNAT family N-acetyltransferase [Anaerolineales bacterium]